MNKQDIILDKICKYYIPDGSYNLFGPNSYDNYYLLYVSEIISPELIFILFKNFKMYNIDVLFFYF